MGDEGDVWELELSDDGVRRRGAWEVRSEDGALLDLEGVAVDDAGTVFVLAEDAAAIIELDLRDSALTRGRTWRIPRSFALDGATYEVPGGRKGRRKGFEGLVALGGGRFAVSRQRGDSGSKRGAVLYGLALEGEALRVTWRRATELRDLAAMEVVPGGFWVVSAERDTLLVYDEGWEERARLEIPGDGDA